jgi:hypothetical protein
MKKDMIKKNVGDHVLLVPQAYRLDKFGFEVRPVRDDDWWLIESVEDEGVTIREPGTGHGRLLGYDHIKSYASDGVLAGAKRGQLLLNVQVTVQGNDVRITPTPRPGEPVPPKTPQVHEQEVDLSWPDTGGLQKRLVTQGYELGWTHRARGNGLIANGTHERVMEPDGHGSWTTFRTRDGMILIKFLRR